MNMENTLDKRDLIIKTIQSMSGKYSVYNVFDDWIKMIALAFANQIYFNQFRENEYIETAKKYDSEELKKLAEMFAWLVEWADEEMTDMLGYIFMHLELGSNKHGQFFTPYHVCRMMAQLQDFDDDEYTANEPSCGAGGNIIALAEAMKDHGINYQKRLIAICQDIDIKAVYMAYIQTTLYGIPAICFQSNTLLDPNGEKSATGKFYTYGYVMKNGGTI